jgi:hypothetical protein
MKFRCSHTFTGIDLPAYEQLYFDEAFNTALCQAVGLQRTLVSRTQDGNRIQRVVKVAPDRQVPGPVAKVLGGARIEYTEHVDYTLGSGRGTWRTVSSLLTDKVKSAGTMAFAARSGGVERTVDGEIEVKIMLVGGTVEKFIVEDVEQSYSKAAEFTRKWLAGGGKG